MKLYENVVIGNFLYGLGVSVGARLGGNVLPASVNLLQQTPEDSAPCDAPRSFPGTPLLIEFTRPAKPSANHSARLRNSSTALLF